MPRRAWTLQMATMHRVAGQLGVMARKPPNVSWLGFTQEQAQLLDFLDHLGNNGWVRNSQSEELMPKLMGDLGKAGLTVDRVKEAMASTGYSKDALHELDRWESKRTTGRLDRKDSSRATTPPGY